MRTPGREVLPAKGTKDLDSADNRGLSAGTGTQVAQPTPLPGSTIERLRRHGRLQPRGNSKGRRSSPERPGKDCGDHGKHAAAAVLHDDGEAEQGDLVLRVAVWTEPQNLNNDHNCTCAAGTSGPQQRPQLHL